MSPTGGSVVAGRRPDEPLHEMWLRARALQDSGSPAAATGLLERILAVDPGSRCVRERLAMACFDLGRYVEAAEHFRELVVQGPDDDYACFGLGMALWRLQRLPEAVDPLASAVAMRPDRPEYGRALGQVRATLRARAAMTCPDRSADDLTDPTVPANPCGGPDA